MEHNRSVFSTRFCDVCTQLDCVLGIRNIGEKENIPFCERTKLSNLKTVLVRRLHEHRCGTTKETIATKMFDQPKIQKIDTTGGRA